MKAAEFIDLLMTFCKLTKTQAVAKTADMMGVNDQTVWSWLSGKKKQSRMAIKFMAVLSDYLHLAR